MSKKKTATFRNFIRMTQQNGKKWPNHIKTMEQAMKEKERKEKLIQIQIEKQNEQTEKQDKQKETNEPRQTMKNLYRLESIELEEATEKQGSDIIETPRGKRAITQDKAYTPPSEADTDITDLIKAIQTIRKYIAETPKEIEELKEKLSDCNYETVDLLHAIELSDPDDSEKMKIYENIKEMRKRRRSYKQRLSYIEEISLAVKKAPWLTGILQQLQFQLELLKKKEENAAYAPRIRTDIKENENIKYFTAKQAEKLEIINKEEAK